MALAVIWISVVVGVVLGLWQRVATRTTGPIRTFAVVAAGLVVALSLLPHAIASEGLAGLCVAMASVAFVPALERLVRVPFRKVDAEGLRLELGFAGLLVHRFGDGVVMAVDGHGLDLSWAVGAHEIPIVALVTLAYARRGLTPALVRAALLGLASSFGFWVVSSMPGTWHDLHGWVDAIAAGILVHILAYEALPESLETERERALDVLGAALGLAIILLPSFDAHESVPNVARQLLHASLEAAPALMLGLVCSAALLVRFPKRASAGARVGSAQSWPGVEAYALAARSLGGLWAAAFWISASVLNRVAGAAVRRLGLPNAELSATPASADAGRTLPFWATLETLVVRVGGWIALGLLGQSYIQSFVPDADPLAALTVPARAAISLALALPASVCVAGAVPIAAALVEKGFSSGAVVAGLVLGPLIGKTLEVQRRAGVRLRRSLLVALPLAALALGLALALDSVLPPAPLPLLAPSGSTGLLDWAALVALGLLVAKSVWRIGIRGWLGISLRSLGSATRREHAHVH